MFISDIATTSNNFLLTCFAERSPTHFSSSRKMDAMSTL